MIQVMRVLGSLLLATVACQTSPPTLERVRSIPLPDVHGRIDHLALDASGSRLFVAALGNGSIEVIDLQRGERTAEIGDLAEPQGIVYRDSSHRVITACGGDGSVHAFDASKLEPVQRWSVGGDADNLRLEPSQDRLWVACRSGALVALTSATEPAAEIELDGHPESFQIQADGKRIFANVPRTHSVAVIDPAARKVTARWELPASGNYPMALDEKDHRLFLPCRRPSVLLVVDTESGDTVAKADCVGDADDVFLDPKTQRLFVAGGEGYVDVFDAKGEPHRLERVPTGRGARTALLVPDRRRLFVAVPSYGKEPAQVLEFALVD